jgi:MYXO-CTERM domain-containing protein
MRHLITQALFLAAALTAPRAAMADACDTSGSSALTCNSSRNTSVGWDLFAQIGGLFDADAYQGCGVTGDYGNPQDAWIFTCPRTGLITVKITNLECDLDLFVLDDACDTGSTSSCLGASVRGGNASDQVTFTCTTGQIYYFGVERVEANWTPDFLGGDCQWYDDHDYRIEVECIEDCFDLFDNDGDGYVDCLDPDCPVCQEDCDDEVDNDFDNLIDCEDSDCARENHCCDRDGDTYRAAGGICNGDDCNDEPTLNGNHIYPTAPEVRADGIDQNCDGREECYIDLDGDFFGIPQTDYTTYLSCLTTGFSINPDDCDDADRDVNPDAPEVPADGVDSDCDGKELCYVDRDNDNYGSVDLIETPDVLCLGAGLADNADDCDDNDRTINPGATEIPISGKDENCDALEICAQDLDGDGYGTPVQVSTSNIQCIGVGVSVRTDDCNDTPGVGSVIYPGATEGRADGVDQNCDTFEECWLDNDLDTYGTDQDEWALTTNLACNNPGFSVLHNDCNDEDPDTHPGAPDPAGDGIDQDCDNLQDCYQDLDGDGFGSVVVVESAAVGCIGVGVSPETGDCDDTSNAIHPDANEITNDGVDGDCDGFETCFQDIDNDNYGSTLVMETIDLTCLATGAADNDDDCDDTPPDGGAIFPGATEIPNNGIDENCDAKEICYLDSDNDGYGVPVPVQSVSLDCDIVGVAPNSTDCNDGPTGFSINPGANERPVDNVDQNCDGLEDCYVDNDLDTFGIPVITTSTTLSCTAPGVSRRQDDCDDNDEDIYPGAPQGPLGGVDYDCSDDVLCFRDLDLDGYGSAVTVVSNDPTCSMPGMSITNDDCNDQPGNGGAAINPNALETPNNQIDQNCDGFEDCYQDNDDDGFGTVNLRPDADLTCNADGVSPYNTDCNDNPSNNGDNVFPGATEIPASDYDENCDGLEDCYRDDDNDNYGHVSRKISTTDVTCQIPNTPYTDNNLDCDDASPSRNPGATDLPSNNIDEDCDGVDTCYQDLDGDSFGSSIRVHGTNMACTGPGVSPLGTDCYDLPPSGHTIYPGATEIAGNGIDDNCDGSEACFRDRDGDTFGDPNLTVASTDLLCQGAGLTRNNEDCNDNPFGGGALINPNAAEVVGDAVDQNCDGLEDCYVDQDNDRYGSPNLVQSPSMTCAVNGVAPNDDDCYDLPPAGASIYPGASEVAGNGIDENCDGREACYSDVDRDGYGRVGSQLLLTTSIDCSAPGFSTTNDDCNDSAGAGPPINPGAIEQPNDGVDQDCDGLEDCYEDVDGDDYGRTTTIGSADITCQAVGVASNDDDCNDLLPGGNFIYPNAPEVVGNGIDEDCNGQETCWTDADDDGYGGGSTVNSASLDCDAPNATGVAGDCNDANNQVYPTRPEVIGDDIDQDCNGVDDCYRDLDRDLFGGDTVMRGSDLSCDTPGEARVSGDCLDVGTVQGVRASQINPDATEVCNSVDDDCDTLVDDNDDSLSSQYLWFLDDDGDGYGTPGTSIAVCEGVEGYSDDDRDCDDEDPAINPDADEVCDPLGVDEDCNGAANIADPGVVDTITYYPDVDRDGYGSSNPALAIEECVPPANHVTNNGDCNDASSLSNPSRTEVVYDGLDNDCDPGTLDDDLDQDSYDHDVDCNDVPGSGGNVNPGGSEGSQGNGIDDNCNGRVDDTTEAYDDDGDGYTEDGGDCNDGNPTIHPGATEGGNSLDDDCDGTVDEGTNRYDDDGDGYTELVGDCNDGDPAANPGLTEVMDNGVDDDCDDNVDGGTYDPDHDGYTTFGGDCNELNGDVFPGAIELADGLDNDCDGTIDEGTALFDDDGDGYTEAVGDCNDNPQGDGAAVNPGEVEIGNGIDDDCDGQIDEGSLNSDDDGDGFADNQGDCDDANPDIFPGADELANELDDNCDGDIDESVIDVDRDGWTEADGDCDDENGWAHPEGVEVCDLMDNDCDGQVDEGTDCDLTEEVDTGVGDEPKGCGCASGGATPSSFLLLTLVGLLLRRRR